MSAASRPHPTLVSLVSALALAAAACGKSSATASADHAPTVAAPGTALVTAPPPLPAAPPAAPAVEKVEFANIEMSTTATATVVHNEMFTVTYPGKPKFSTFDAPYPGSPTPLTGGMLIYANPADDGALGTVVVPLPKDVPYDVEKGLDGMRDGMTGKMHATIETQTKATIGGTLPGRIVLATFDAGGKPARMEIRMGVDMKRRVAIATMAMHFVESTAMQQLGEAFTASLKLTP